jgi:hypothetical protein
LQNGNPTFEIFVHLGRWNQVFIKVAGVGLCVERRASSRGGALGVVAMQHDEVSAARPTRHQLLIHTLTCCRCLSLNLCQNGTLVLRRAQSSCARAPTWEVQPLTRTRPTDPRRCCCLSPTALLAATHARHSNDTLFAHANGSASCLKQAYLPSA